MRGSWSAPGQPGKPQQRRGGTGSKRRVRQRIQKRCGPWRGEQGCGASCRQSPQDCQLSMTLRDRQWWHTMSRKLRLWPEGFSQTLQLTSLMLGNRGSGLPWGLGARTRYPEEGNLGRSDRRDWEGKPLESARGGSASYWPPKSLRKAFGQCSSHPGYKVSGTGMVPYPVQESKDYSPTKAWKTPINVSNTWRLQAHCSAANLREGNRVCSGQEDHSGCRSQ